METNGSPGSMNDLSIEPDMKLTIKSNAFSMVQTLNWYDENTWKIYFYFWNVYRHNLSTGFYGTVGTIGWDSLKQLFYCRYSISFHCISLWLDVIFLIISCFREVIWLSVIWIYLILALYKSLFNCIMIFKPLSTVSQRALFVKRFKSYAKAIFKKINLT